MKSFPLLAGLLAGLLASCATAPDSSIDDSPAGQISSMSWLAGDWVGPSARGTWEAHYSTPSGGLILGTSKELIEEGGLRFEFEHFAVEGDVVVVRPHLNGSANTVAFTLTTLDREAHKAVFENLEHDFPTRLEYHRADFDTLVRAVSGPENEEGKRPGIVLVLKAAQLR